MPTSALMSSLHYYKDNGYHQTIEIGIKNCSKIRLTLRSLNGSMSGLSGCHGSQPDRRKPGSLPEGIIAPSFANLRERMDSLQSPSRL